MRHLIYAYGYPALFVLAFLEVAYVPVSSEVILVSAGILAGSHRLSLLPSMVVALAGETSGATAAYVVALKGGRAFFQRWGRYLLVSERDLERVEGWFARRGALSVFVSRVLPLIRCFGSFPAGVARVPLTRFVVLSAAGSAVWIVALTLVGYGVGRALRHQIDTVLSSLGYGLAVVAAGVVALFFAHRFIEYRRELRRREVNSASQDLS
jgi:membrane protein DedA with SNARE-associated domain